MSFADLLAEDRRLVILRALAEDHDYRLADSTVKRVLEHFGHGVSRAMVRGDMQWLSDQRLLRIERIATEAGELWVATLTEDGADVARGRPHPGVARPAPG